VWHEAERRLRVELRRIDDVADDLRAGTKDLRWQGPGAGRFRWRTQRRLRELTDQRQLLQTALTLVRRAGDAAERSDAAARSGTDRRRDRTGVSGGGEA